MIVFAGNRAIAGAAISIVAIACSSSSSPSSSSGLQCPAAPDACSNGTPYAMFGGIPVAESVADDAGASCGPCTPHCGAITIAQTGTPDQQYTLAAAPSGPCTSEGEVCTMNGLLNAEECDDGSNVFYSTCMESEVRCSCANGNWSCVVTSEGKSSCGCGSFGTN